MSILLSIIIPVYNSEKYLYKTIESILNQDLKDVEVICIDDGSTDGSLAILEKYKKTNEFIVIHQDNQGAPAARNYGLSLATGKYVLFFDSDDLMNDSSVSTVKKYLNKNNCDLLISDFCFFDGNYITKKIKHFNNRFHFSNIDKWFFAASLPPFPGNKIYKKEIVEKNGIFFAELKIGQDLNFYLKYLFFAKNIKYLNCETCMYRLSEGGISRSYDIRILDIINCFNDVESFGESKNLYYYNNELNIIFYSNLVYQLGKVKYVQDLTMKQEMTYLLNKEIIQRQKLIRSLSLYERMKIHKIDLLYKKTSNM